MILFFSTKSFLSTCFCNFVFLNLLLVFSFVVLHQKNLIYLPTLPLLQSILMFHQLFCSSSLCFKKSPTKKEKSVLLINLSSFFLKKTTRNVFPPLSWAETFSCARRFSLLCEKMLSFLVFFASGTAALLLSVLLHLHQGLQARHLLLAEDLLLLPILHLRIRASKVSFCTLRRHARLADASLLHPCGCWITHRRAFNSTMSVCKQRNGFHELNCSCHRNSCPELTSLSSLSCKSCLRSSRRWSLSTRIHRHTSLTRELCTSRHRLQSASAAASFTSWTTVFFVACVKPGQQFKSRFPSTEDSGTPVFLTAFSKLEHHILPTFLVLIASWKWGEMIGQGMHNDGARSLTAVARNSAPLSCTDASVLRTLATLTCCGCSAAMLRVLCTLTPLPGCLVATLAYSLYLWLVSRARAREVEPPTASWS